MSAIGLRIGQRPMPTRCCRAIERPVVGFEIRVGATLRAFADPTAPPPLHAGLGSPEQVPCLRVVLDRKATRPTTAVFVQTFSALDELAADQVADMREYLSVGKTRYAREAQRRDWHVSESATMGGM